MDLFENFLIEHSLKNESGTLTIGEALINHYYRLLEGEHAGRVVINSCAKIDDKPVLFFANGMTWIYREKLANVRCKMTYPIFPAGGHPIDYSKASWYDDSGGGPHHHEW